MFSKSENKTHFNRFIFLNNTLKTVLYHYITWLSNRPQMVLIHHCMMYRSHVYDAAYRSYMWKSPRSVWFCVSRDVYMYHITLLLQKIKHVCLRDMYKYTGQNPLFSKLYYTDKTSNKLTKMTSHLHILLSCIHHSVNNMFWWLTFFMFTHGNWISWPLILSDRPPVKQVTVFKLERSQVNLNGYYSICSLF